jgi:hypothetical protein
MRFAVEAWAPEYGAPLDGDELVATTAEVDLDVEVPAADWAPRAPPPLTRPPASILFTDGVRRIDARVWLTDDGGRARPGICASFAAGAVRCDGRAVVVAAHVERGLFTAAGDAQTIETGHGAYAVQAVGGESPEVLSQGLQQRMGALEVEVAHRQSGAAGLVVVDGPLRTVGPYPSGTVGYVKTHATSYLPEGPDRVIAALAPGQRTPLFCLTFPLQTKWSWYLRLPEADAVALADTTAAVLPRFASQRHKDPRAPQNLVPIGGLERRLRHVLGDADLLFRALARAASRPL